MANKGSFKPGRKKTGGRKAGVQNKVTRDMREMIATLQAESFDRLAGRLDELEAKDLARLFCALCDYSVPKLSRTESRMEISSLPAEEAERLLHALTDKFMSDDES